MLNRTASAISNNALRFSAIKVDGKILVDHNNIGVDDSGNGNHFQDENFAAGNTDEVWNQSLVSTGTNMSGGINAALKAFDGNLNTAAAVKQLHLETATQVLILSYKKLLQM